VLAAVLEAICLRTGYPRDMLDPGLDLEADLSIDSIKRVEIVAELADRIGLPATGTAVADSVVERLAKVKTISGIVDFCLATMAPSDTVAETAGTGAPVRYVTERVPLEAAPPIDGETLRGRRFVVVEDGHGVALELAALLEEHGARVQSASADRLAELPDLDGAAGLVDLGGLGPAQRPVLPGAFAGLRRALLAGVPRLLLVTGSGGVFGHGWRGDPTPGAGARGFVRTAAIEFPDLSVRAVDLDPKGDPTALAARVLSELCAPQGPVVVGYAGGTRTTPRVRAAELTSGATGTPLGPDSVVLLTGGARGITARVALALAHASRCHIEIVGRTLPEAEDPATAGAADQAALRAVLIGRGMRAPAEIEAESARLLAARRVRATLAELEGVAASVRYHALDVRDGNALRATVADVHARHGRLDGVVHGAGVLEDRLLGDKDPLSFARVFDTKVEGARALAEELPHDTGFLVLFGSVAGVFGNRGQADYAAANDALDTFAHAWSGRLGARVLAVDWGPWAAAGGGMVTPELERAYSRRGIRLLDPDRAVAALLAELAHGTEGQVLYVAEGTDLGAADAG
jgi:NAD(P)-dependent dehydrogenase (short-subunit alcohol dehydrogenase family)